MRRLSIMLALLGLALAAVLVLRFDAGEVLHAMLSVGWTGAAVLLIWQVPIMFILGLAWSFVQPEIGLRVLIWGRMVRDAATTCLPFSPVGGYVLGVRAVTLRGPSWVAAAAGTVVDVSAELCAQFLFALLGLGLLLALRPNADLAWPIAIALLAVLAIAAAVITQRARIGTVLQVLAERLFGPATDIQHLRTHIAHLAARRPRFLLAIALHLTGWIATGIGTWISLRLLGHPGGLPGILALEALLDAAVAVAFVVPAAAGVQEAGYVGLGAIFGVPPDIALSVSLLRRAREVAWGLPILGVWQWQELRRL